MKHLVFLSFWTLLLSSCNLGIPKITPFDIYSYEAANYPGTSWEYIGSKGAWHYFNQPTSWIGNHDWKLHRKHLPDLRGFPYYAKPSPQRRKLSADVEIHDEFIRIHIDEHPPYRIPFKSKGFITADHRSGNRNKIRVYSNGQDVTDEIESSMESLPPTRETGQETTPNLSSPTATASRAAH